MMNKAKAGTTFVACLCCGVAFASGTSVIPTNLALQWNNAALQGIRDSNLGAPIAARVLAVVHTCMYDAWAAYDERADGTQFGAALRRPYSERILTKKEEAISYAAYRALTDLMPGDQEALYRPLMRTLGYDPNNNSIDIETAAGIGNVTCAAVLEYRHNDRSNQLGELAPGPYSDWTGFVPANKPSTVPIRGPIVNPDHWQPLTFISATGDLVTQRFMAAHWCEVVPFALGSGGEFRVAIERYSPAQFGSDEYLRQAQELISLSAGLTDRQKMIAEYWLDGPKSEQPPGHWMQFAQWVSARDHHTLDDDIKLFFALSNAMFDAGIAAWDTKRAYDSVRPVTAISVLFRGRRIRAWGGPGKGTVEMDGSEWIPYQPTTFPTPPFPDFVSGHSTFSAAAASILTSWTGSDRFGYSVTIPVGSSKVEPNVAPSRPLVFQWTTFTEAADEAGLSRRYGGIHFERADLGGRLLGRLVGEKVWAKAQSYFDGTATPPIQIWKAMSDASWNLATSMHVTPGTSTMDQ
jgi:hypothetical protein